MRFRLDLNSNFTSREKIVAVRVDYRMSYNYEPEEVLPNTKQLTLSVKDIPSAVKGSEHLIEIVTEKGKYLKFVAKEFT